MKLKFNKWSPGLLAVISLYLSASVAKSDQQGYPETFGTLTNLPATLASGAWIGASTNVVPLRTYGGIGLQTIFTGTSGDTGPVTLFVWPSVDGTNINTVAPYAILSYSSVGTGATVGTTNWSNLQLKGINALFITISNGTGGAINLNNTVTNTAGAILPGGVLFNRPNQ